MSRCPRCDACQGFWDVPVCSYCRFPEADNRDAKKVERDYKDYKERTGEDDLPPQ